MHSLFMDSGALMRRQPAKDTSGPLPWTFLGSALPPTRPETAVFDIVGHAVWPRDERASRLRAVPVPLALVCKILSHMYTLHCLCQLLLRTSIHSFRGLDRSQKLASY
ncbi:hypothetical protein DdX_08499 [Ditylenchus destructor]|uniref:Uncharacterized protein n=1 Tax=Ditylenchus destructor TaxID=166010 RepID=A0AAD4N5I6_9BILA|nr:hypothetical protein DdX_08499 [Ditylenchus destructor]